MIATIHPSHIPSLTSQAYSNSRYNRELLEDGVFGDCTIRCKGRSWRAHRNILVPRCHFFSVCFNGRFRESSNGVNEVSMEDDTPDAVEALLYYLYTMEYPGSDAKNATITTITTTPMTNSPDPYVHWARDFAIFAIADKYNLPELMRLARTALLSTTQATNQTSDQHLLREHIDSFVAAVAALYALPTSPSSSFDTDPDPSPLSEASTTLRTQTIATVAEAVTKHVRDPRIAELIAAYSDFAVDVLEALARVQVERELGLAVSLPAGQKDAGGQKGTGQQHQQRRVYIPLNEDSDCEFD